MLWGTAWKKRGRALIVAALTTTSLAGAADDGARAAAVTPAPTKTIAPLPDGAVKLAPAPVAEAATMPPKNAPVPKGKPVRTPASAASASAGKMVRIPIAVEGSKAVPSQELRITSGSGSIIPGAGGEPVLEAPAGGRVVLSSDPGKENAATSELRENQKTRLPWIVVETPAAGNGAAYRTSRPFLTIDRAVTWDAARKRYVASFLFGLDAESGGAGVLDSPLDARFAVTCEDVQPETAKITTIGPAGYQTITVSCSQAIKNDRKNGQELQVFVDRGALSYPFNLPHRAGPPTLDVDQKNPYGLGFGAPELTVRSVEEDGTPLLADADLPVHFTVEGGNVEPGDLTLAKGAQSASLKLHPRGTGQLQLTAVVRELRSAPVTMMLGFPLVPIVAIISGGLLGGLATTFRKGGTRAKLWRALVQGALIGLLVTALTLLLPSLVDLPSWVVDTELGLFAIAALAGYVGTPLLDRASFVVFPRLTKEKA